MLQAGGATSLAAYQPFGPEAVRNLPYPDEIGGVQQRITLLTDPELPDVEAMKSDLTWVQTLTQPFLDHIHNRCAQEFKQGVVYQNFRTTRAVLRERAQQWTVQADAIDPGETRNLLQYHEDDNPSATRKPRAQLEAEVRALTNNFRELSQARTNFFTAFELAKEQLVSHLLILRDYNGDPTMSQLKEAGTRLRRIIPTDDPLLMKFSEAVLHAYAENKLTTLFFTATVDPTRLQQQLQDSWQLDKDATLPGKTLTRYNSIIEEATSVLSDHHHRMTRPRLPQFFHAIEAFQRAALRIRDASPDSFKQLMVLPLLMPDYSSSTKLELEGTQPGDVYMIYRVLKETQADLPPEHRRLPNVWLAQQALETCQLFHGLHAALSPRMRVDQYAEYFRDAALFAIAEANTHTTAQQAVLVCRETVAKYTAAVWKLATQSAAGAKEQLLRLLTVVETPSATAVATAAVAADTASIMLMMRQFATMAITASPEAPPCGTALLAVLLMLAQQQQKKQKLPSSAA